MMGGPMQTPPAQPELSGLLDDNFATMLEEMLAADPQESIPQCPELSFLQNLAPAEDRTPSLPAFAQQQQAPQGWEPPAHDQHEGWSFEKKRSGSGEMKVLSEARACTVEGDTYVSGIAKIAEQPVAQVTVIVELTSVKAKKQIF